MNGNRVRWSPHDRLPMQSTETTLGSGLALLGLSAGLVALTAPAALELGSRGETGGAALLAGFTAIFALGAFAGLRVSWYRRTISIDGATVRIEVRRLGGSTQQQRPLQAYGAIVQYDSEVRLWRYSSLILPDPDPKLTVCLAMTARGSAALPELEKHFAELLQLPCAGRL